MSIRQKRATTKLLRIKRKCLFLQGKPLLWRRKVSNLGAQTDRDFAMPTEQLAQSLRAQGVRVNLKRGDTTAVLLVR
jgi:hypothetical protein